MICKNCGAELPEGSIACSYCGYLFEQEPEQEPELHTEPTPKKKTQWWVIVLIAVAGLALVAVLVGAVLYGMGINLSGQSQNAEDETGEATVDTTEGTGDAALTPRKNYTVEADVAREKAEQIVAVVGEETLTNGELQIYFGETYSGFLQENYYYLSMFGLDTGKPLNEQDCPVSEGQTWQEFFLEAALSSWHRYTTLQLMGKEAGFELDAEMQSFLDNLPEDFQKRATESGYDSVVAFLEANCGPGATENGYLEYVCAYYEGTFYLMSLYDEMMPTDAEVEEYFAENEEMLAEQGITKENGKSYDVRHILIPVEGGTKNEDGSTTYSDADWEACRQKAQQLLDQWAAEDGTEAGFSLYAEQHSTDGGSNTNGGLYENLTAETNFVQEFKDWYMDESRQLGDTGLVKSPYGYHIMYFSGVGEIWRDTVSQELLTERISSYIDTGMEKYPMEVNYENIVLGDNTTPAE